MDDLPDREEQMTQPLRMLPLVAKYTGAGDLTVEANFVWAPAPGSTDPNQVPASECVIDRASIAPAISGKPDIAQNAMAASAFAAPC
ncbi:MULTISPECIES: hypothetical protein [Paraburkholderia]|uniref:Uncharacterized protein n=1 Tax=Paraburkholderia metrosideri TaxID=580937 RepID=A0ABW9E5H5_9BURK